MLGAASRPTTSAPTPTERSSGTITLVDRRRRSRTRAGTSWCSTRAAAQQRARVRQRRHQPADRRVPAHRRRDRLHETRSDAGRPVTAIGTLPYPEERFGRLRVFEETGRTALRRGQAPRRGSSSRSSRASRSGSRRSVRPEPGRPPALLLPGARSAGRARRRPKIDAHFRGVRERSPTRRPAGSSSSGRRRASIRHWDAAAAVRRIGLPAPPQLNLNVGQLRRRSRTPTRSACCRRRRRQRARRDARLHEARRRRRQLDACSCRLPPGWNEVTLAQVIDSSVGGAWTRELPVEHGRRRRVHRRAARRSRCRRQHDVDATSPKGAPVFYDVTAQHRQRASRSRSTASPRPGSMFPVGTTSVLLHGDRSEHRRRRSGRASRSRSSTVRR